MEYIGPDEVRDSPKAAVLNSRQSKFPVGFDLWVAATGRAVAHLREQESVLVTSLGMNTWELALAFASRLKMKTIVVIPERVDGRAAYIKEVCHRFDLDPSRTGFGFLNEPSGARPKNTWPARDAAVVHLADRLLPVSIRPGGTMASLIEANRHKIDSTFTIPYDKTTRPRPRYEAAVLNPTVDWEQWLIHFTRSSDGPWPDETDLDFYNEMIASTNEYCRSARRTLIHILQTGVIRGSAEKIHGGFLIVPFACVTQDSITRLFRYRPRLLNPGLEPYGIAVAKEAAAAMGVRPVMYGLPDLYDRLPEGDKPFFQHQGSFDSQWIIEQEQRHLGDFPLTRTPPACLRVVVPGESGFPPPANLSLSPVTALFG